MVNQKSFTFVYLLFAAFCYLNNFIVIAHSEIGHACAHDSDEMISKTYQRLHEYFKENPINYSEDKLKRNLGAQTIQPIRITTDFSRLSPKPELPPITNNQVNYLKTVSTTVVNFVSNFIKVQPNTSNNIFDPKQSIDGTCITVKPLKKDRTDGVSDSDLHLYFIYTSDPDAGFLANAGFCNLQQGETYLRPNFGRVLFNIANMKNFGTNLEQFQNDVMITLHEIIHVLGFSYGAMQSWYDKASNWLLGQEAANKLISTQTLRGIQTNLLGSPNVLATAKKYYGCPTLQGMQLENQGGPGSQNSHWERTIIRSELMTPSALVEDLNLTVFTVAVLKDTGYWDDVNENLSDPIYWGRNKGCDFFQNACQSSTQYEEFATANQKGCSFWGDGQGIGSTSDRFGDNCSVIEIYSNNLCSDIANQSQQTNPPSFNADTSNDYSYNSKCFTSSVYSPTAQNHNEIKNFRCHFYQCTPDKTQVTITFSQIPDTKIVCGTSDQGSLKNVIFKGNTLGQVTCPSSIQRLCDDQKCVNFCSYNGICIRGQCLCNPGYGGVDCSKQCSNFIDQDGNCQNQCPSNTYANFDKVCRSTCPIGTYPDNNSGVCKQCDFSCSQCSGPRSNQCQACQFLTYLFFGTCVTSCPSGTYPDEPSKSCLPCSNGCQTCTSPTTCSQCKTGFQLSGQMCTSIFQCTIPCASCSSDPKYCTSCINGLFLTSQNTCVSSCPAGYFQNNQNMTCDPCSTGCSQCSDANTCTLCDISIGYRIQGNACTLCVSPCATCSYSNPNSCFSCENKMYLVNNQCVSSCTNGYYNGPNYNCSQCITGCSQCSDRVSCTQCSNNYKLFTQNNTQICISSSSCFSPCSTCIGTFQPTTCASCKQGSYLQANSCVSSCDQGYFLDQPNQRCTQCSNGCAKCSNSTTCAACINNYFLLQNNCVQTCPDGTYTDQISKTCQNCPNGCSKCTSYTICSQCQNGFQFSGQKCTSSQCTNPCASCTSDPSHCTTCIGNLYISPQNTCVSTCPTGYFQNNSNMTCTACPIGCISCSDAKTCIKCDDSNGYRLQGNSCTLCVYPCATCSTSNPNSCLSCENKMYLLNNQCVSSCTNGYYNGPNYTCSQCISGCSQCSDGVSCTSCSNNYKLFPQNNVQICISSSSCFSPCSTCIGTFQPTTCSSCNQGFYLQANSCVAQCDQGYFLDQSKQRCTQCSNGCAKCSNSGSCTLCSNNYYLQQNNCVLTCSDGKYADQTSKICQSCPNECSKCTSSTICSQCQNGFQLSGQKCTAVQCATTCASCTSDPTQCISCIGGLYLSPHNTCDSSCPSGYFQNNSNMICTACPAGCISCSDAKTCTKCDSLNGYRLQGSSCTLCVSPCATCSQINPSICLSCENNMYLLNNKCVSTCTNGFYNGLNYTCSPCINGCNQCLDGNSCISCNANYQLFTYNNVQICISQSSCFSPCSTCQGVFQPKTCASCNKSFYLQDSSCVAQCNKGYFANQYNQMCTQCPSNCSACSGPTSCSACSNNYILSLNSCVAKCPQGFTNNNQICTQINKYIETQGFKQQFAILFLVILIVLSF
ncbi:leishmanolysin family protein (macronuclear) [Tetrahymena thermophila SB210]|uniref:Leishmanolysin family protein n=1 Tax=Tetrahymena thermophila (strain SB210) TaxID=312017 RepID=Q23JG3_TETTS|nr:leishmanolysin family protein [Tetrahymena thermophila SB210]EAR96681.1 leishmanolysin family protein [Tetrahymena thermophila SB210]|eukprot:XP_001016926.1 leishmanolysin family protein [Tetrahymena thermophila SB210]